MPVVRIIGPGRAGSSLARSLGHAGWSVAPALGRGDDPTAAASGVDLLVISTPDGAIAEVAAAVTPNPACVVAHLAGSLGLDVLAPHPRRGALHPLRSLPTGDTSLSGAWFAVDGDPLVTDAVVAAGGRPVPLAGHHRTAYHAAAVIASNHLVALLGQVERVAAAAGVPLEAYLDLVRGTVANVERLGPAAALTGPVARGDWPTVDAHLAALPDEERAAYLALAEQCARLAGRSLPQRAEVPA